MKKRYWILGGLALLGAASLIAGGSSSGSVCARAETKKALNETFIAKLPKLGASLMDDYAALGQQGEAVVCSVSFSLKPLTKESLEAIGQAPRTAVEAQSYALGVAMVPNLMAHAQTNPGQPLVQRVTYRVTKTLDDRVVVTVVDFPGARNLR